MLSLICTRLEKNYKRPALIKRPSRLSAHGKSSKIKYKRQWRFRYLR